MRGADARRSSASTATLLRLVARHGRDAEAIDRSAVPDAAGREPRPDGRSSSGGRSTSRTSRADAGVPERPALQRGDGHPDDAGGPAAARGRRRSGSSSIVGARGPGRSRDKQIALLETFADQAVIAIENVRLFTGARGAEPRADRGARAADGHQRDPAGDQPARRPIVQPVFDTIARERRAAVRGASSASIFRFDGELLHGRAPSSCAAGARRAARREYPIAPGRGPSSARGDPRARGRPHRRRRGADPEYADRASIARAGLPDACSACPMLREGDADRRDHRHRRPRSGPFTDKQIALLADLRRPGGHRHRERAAVQGAAGADGRS